MGLGDFIRGSIASKQLCNEYSIPFEMDFRHHPMSNYLKCINTQDPLPIDSLINLQDIPNFTIRALKANLTKHTSLRNIRKNDIGIYTNVWPIFKIRKDVSYPIRNGLQPNDECESAIQGVLGELKDYRVIHVRAGDLLAFNTQVGDVVDHTLDDIIKSLTVIEKIKAQSDIPCIVMSDSYECKQLISKIWGIPCTPTVPAHLALEKNSVLDTLVDFFILSRAQVIHQFSVHHWGSGFSDSVNWVYNVPVVKHKLM